MVNKRRDRGRRMPLPAAPRRRMASTAIAARQRKSRAKIMAARRVSAWADNKGGQRRDVDGRRWQRNVGWKRRNHPA